MGQMDYGTSDSVGRWITERVTALGDRDVATYYIQFPPCSGAWLLGMLCKIAEGQLSSRRPWPDTDNSVVHPNWWNCWEGQFS